jgi:hypothetical protein
LTRALYLPSSTYQSNISSTMDYPISNYLGFYDIVL